MRVFKFFKSLIDGFILKRLIKNSFGDAQGFADACNRESMQYWDMRIINNNKYLTRSVQGVLYLFNYDRTHTSDDEYIKTRVWTNVNKFKFTSQMEVFDYEDYKKIIFYDELYEVYTHDFLYWNRPDNKPTEQFIIDFVAKVEAYPKVKLRDIKSKFGC